jgi:hypothetical protein
VITGGVARLAIPLNHGRLRSLGSAEVIAPDGAMAGAEFHGDALVGTGRRWLGDTGTRYASHDSTRISCFAAR